MDLFSLLQVVVRRWAVVVPIVLLTIAAAVMVGRAADGMYEASGSVLVAPPTFSPGSGLAQQVDIAGIAVAVREDESLDDLRADDEFADFQIEIEEDGSLQVVATGISTVAVERTAEIVAELLIEGIEASQEDREPESRIRPRVDSEQAVAQDISAEDDEEQYLARLDIVVDDPGVLVNNPYTASPPTGRLLQVAVMSAEGQQRVSQITDDKIGFEIFQDWQDRAAILEVAAYGPSPESSLQGFDAVTAILAEVLDERQQRAGVPPSQRILIEVLAAPGGARNVSPPVDRSVAVAVALGLLAAIGAALAVENLQTHRQRKHKRDTDDAAGLLWPVHWDDQRSTPQSSSSSEAARVSPPPRT